MNFLAHLFLSHETAEAVVGALLGDFVKGRLTDERYPPAIIAGIRRHRAIDCYTDAHPLVRASRNVVSGPRRRFAPILIDLFYDHLLARDWRCYSAVPLGAFTRSAYAVLAAHAPSFPEPLRQVLPRLIGEDWLGAYAERTGIERALAGLSRRVRRGDALVGGVEELVQNEAVLQRYFDAFFAELCAEVARWK